METQKSNPSFVIGLTLLLTLLVSVGGTYLFVNGRHEKRIQKTQRATKPKEKEIVIRRYNSPYDGSASGTGKHILRELAITGGLIGGLTLLFFGGNAILKRTLSPEAYESFIKAFWAAVLARR